MCNIPVHGENKNKWSFYLSVISKNKLPQSTYEEHDNVVNVSLVETRRNNFAIDYKRCYRPLVGLKILLLPISYKQTMESDEPQSKSFLKIMG